LGNFYPEDFQKVSRLGKLSVLLLVKVFSVLVVFSCAKINQKYKTEKEKEEKITALTYIKKRGGVFFG